MGELTSFLMYTIYVGVSFAGLSGFYTNFMKGAGASTRLFELLERTPKITSISSKKVLEVIAGKIEFRNVSFRYPSRPEMKVLDDFNLEIKANESIALVGTSGCGKSTVAALLARFYELQTDHCKGAIFIDGIDISTVNPIDLRSHISAVPQEPALFATSISENIAYGSSEASMEDIITAAKEANAHEFIMSLPDGYDSQVGERGQALSGGQKQRVAIARALVKQPRILILDEATSALDSESERLVQDAVTRATMNRTVLLISHRLTTIKSADRIAVIKDGGVVEQGTFMELSTDPHSAFSEVALQLH